ncbi:MAG: hypothetical protein R3F55_08085 [Alphaproteobacteria bacterium]
MSRLLTSLALGAAALAASAAAHAETIVLRDITTPIVPTQVLAGDREFGGNGPRMTVGVELSIGRGGRAIFANVHFTATEMGGDGSRTAIDPAPILVWRFEDDSCRRTVVAIESQSFSLLSHDSAPGCGPFGCGLIAGPGQSIEDGGLVLPVVPQNPGPVATVTLLGDTTGDDISTDSNPSGDTSIRAIRFNPIDVSFAPGLGCG